MQSQSENSTQDDQSVQPSFDEVVELISTGRADQIPGIKDIPLKINEATPSAPTMSRPAKPWERATEQEDNNANSQSEQNDISINANNTQVSQS